MSEEELESIPWSTLIEDGQPQRNRLIYIAAGALIVFAIAVLAGRALRSPQPAEIPVAVEATTTTSATPATAAPVAAPILFSEADLMASLDNESSRAAAAFAEWFVYDYFTVDGDAANVVSIQGALPPGVPTELLPHSSAEGVTYVEWARAGRVTAVSPGRFEVLVLFRTVAGDGTEFERQPVRAVVVPMEMGAAGGLRLTDLPSPAHVPQRPTVPEWLAPEGPESPELAGMALALGWPGLDADPIIAGSSKEGDTWRMLVVNHLPSGTGWPFVLSIPDDLVD